MSFAKKLKIGNDVITRRWKKSSSPPPALLSGGAKAITGRTLTPTTNAKKVKVRKRYKDAIKTAKNGASRLLEEVQTHVRKRVYVYTIVCHRIKPLPGAILSNNTQFIKD